MNKRYMHLHSSGFQQRSTYSHRTSSVTSPESKEQKQNGSMVRLFCCIDHQKEQLMKNMGRPVVRWMQNVRTVLVKNGRYTFRTAELGSTEDEVRTVGIKRRKLEEKLSKLRRVCP